PLPRLLQHCVWASTTPSIIDPANAEFRSGTKLEPQTCVHLRHSIRPFGILKSLHDAGDWPSAGITRPACPVLPPDSATMSHRTVQFTILTLLGSVGPLAAAEPA